MSDSPSSRLLLALPPSLQIIDLCQEDDHLTVLASTTAVSAACPRCQTLSLRTCGFHSRRLSDLPCAGRALRLQVIVRRFRCETPDCPQRTFMERLTGFARPHARRTDRLRQAQTTLAFAEGGRAGRRAAARLGLATSLMTLLRELHRAPVPSPPIPQALGVDDFAFRKGHTYGTLLFDLQSHRPVDLLPDRTAETLSEWLSARPDILLVSRDRFCAYADAITKALPDAIQVADRWHLFKNLGDHLAEWIDRKKSHWTKELTQNLDPEEAVVRVESARLEETIVSKEPEKRRPGPRAGKRPTLAEQRKRESQDRREERYVTIQRLYQHGYNICEIKRQTGHTRGTIRKYLRTESCPTFDGEKRRSRLEAYRAFFEERIEGGERNATQLWRELKEQGYPGGPSQVIYFVHRLLNDRKATLAPGEQPPQAPLKKREVVGWILRSPEDLKEKEKARLQQLQETSEEFRKGCDLAQRFATMARERRGTELIEWIRAAKASGIRELKRFAVGLESDRQAVENGLTLKWSNGPTEGFNNRLKEIKRRMYGRASFDLLRRMVLQPP